jgi:hypothetical protein
LLSGNIFLTTIGNAQPINGVLSQSLKQTGQGVNNSLQSTNSQFDPFILSPATFTFNLAGLSPNATVTGVKFNFGTQIGEGVGCGGTCGGGGTGGPAPEPAAWTMMIAGFGGVGALMRRRRSVIA